MEELLTEILVWWEEHKDDSFEGWYAYKNEYGDECPPKFVIIAKTIVKQKGSLGG
jgi:hypothetical protein